MNHLAAALLLSLATKEINEKNIEEVLKAAGAKVKPDEIKKVVEKCKGKTHDALVKEGLAKLSGMGAGAADDKKKEEPKKEVKKKEEPKKKEEKPVEEDDDEGGIGDLF